MVLFFKFMESSLQLLIWNFQSQNSILKCFEILRANFNVSLKFLNSSFFTWIWITAGNKGRQSNDQKYPFHDIDFLG